MIADCRALLQGWIVRRADRGWLDVSSLVHSLGSLVPPSWCPILVHPGTVPRFRAVADEEVVVIACVPSSNPWQALSAPDPLRQASADFGAADFRDPSAVVEDGGGLETAAPQLPSGREPADREPEEATTRQCSIGGPVSFSFARSQPRRARSFHRRAPLFVLLVLILGTSFRPAGAVQTRCPTACLDDSLQHPPGACGMVLPLVVAGATVQASGAADLAREASTSTICCHAVRKHFSSGTPDAQADGSAHGARSGLDVDSEDGPKAPPKGYVQVNARLGRPVPTPCRGGRSAFMDLQIFEPTLLEGSLQQTSCTAMFDASTLLETLSEHYACRPHKLAALLTRKRPPVLRAEVALSEALPPANDLVEVVPPMPITPLSFSVAEVFRAQTLRLGSTPLGFTGQDLWQLFRDGRSLVTWSQAKAVVPDLRPFSMSGILAWIQMHYGDTPPNVCCFTDGSFFPSPDSCPPRLGWACLFVHPATRSASCAWGRVPDDLLDIQAGVSAYTSECAALLAANLLAITHLQNSKVAYLSDCQAALAALAGTAAQQAGLPAAMCNARAARAQLGGSTDTFEHIAGHAGYVGNEFVDRLSKWGATHFQSAVGLSRPLDTVLFWLADGGHKLSWAALAVRAMCRDCTLPPLCTDDLGHDRDHAGLTPYELLRPFIPNLASGSSERSGDASTACEVSYLTLSIVSFNALSLLPGDDRPLGLAYQPGASAILAEQLRTHDVGIALIQESRCPPGKLTTGAYTRLCSGAERGQWGVEVWLREGWPLLKRMDGQPTATLHATGAIVLFSDPRRIIVRLVCKPLSFLLVALHGPHRAFESARIADWWEDTTAKIRQFLRNDVLIVAGDLNAALGSRVTEAVGDLAAEPEDLAGEHVQELMTAFRLLCPCTFSQWHQGASFTYYQKKCDRVCRVDYILVPDEWRSGMLVSRTLPDIHAGHAVQDHIAVGLTFETQITAGASVPRRERRGPRAVDLCDDNNRAYITEVLRAAPAVPWHVSTHAHAAILTEHVQQGLAKLRPAAAGKPRHPYLSSDTWTLQQAVAKTRRALHLRKFHLERHRLLACFKAWRSDALTFDQAFTGLRWVRQMVLLQTVQVDHLRDLSKSLRRACKLDRDMYISGLADAISNGPPDGVFAALHRILAHRRKRPYTLDPVPALQHPDGTACTGPEEMRRLWRSHFGNLEAGEPTAFSAIARDAAEGLGEVAKLPPLAHPPDVSVIASYADMIHILCGTKVAKAPGFDALPPELCRRFPQELAPLLHPILLKTAWRGEEPVGWKGGKAVYFYKNRGEHHSPASYRSVLLLSTWAKVNHKCLRPPLKEHFEQTAPALQMGGKTGFSVVFGAHVIRAIASWATSQGCTSFTLFADIASAFYSAITQLVAGPRPAAGSDTLLRLTRHLRLSDSELTALREHLSHEPAMATAGAHPWIQGTVARMSTDNWFLLQNDDVPVKTGRGTRPGSSFADLVFALLVPKILQVRDRMRNEAGNLSQAPAFPWDGERSLAPCQTDTYIQVEDVVWADDLAVPRVCGSPDTLKKALAAETAALTDACGEHGLVLAYGPHKTAAIATVRGGGSRRVRQALYGRTEDAGVVKVLREHHGSASLPLVPSYKHLGVQQQPAGAIAEELKYRVSQARAAFQEARRKIFRNRAISLARKAFLLQTLVLPRLTQGAGSWPVLTSRDRRTFDSAVWSFYRSILCIPRQGDQEITAFACFALTGLPSPDTLLRKCRLQYLRQMVASAPDELWAIVRADRLYAECLLNDLHWMFLWIQGTSDAKPPRENWAFWRSLMAARPGTFKGWLKRAVSLDNCRIHLAASLEGLHRAMVRSAGTLPSRPDLDCTELCIPCKRAFATRVAWAAHAARAHGYRSRAHLKASGTICLSCGKDYSNVHRLRRHLVSVPKCVQQWGQFVPEPSVRRAAQGHPLAPPCPVAGTAAPLELPDDDDEICLMLLDDLRSSGDCSEAELWSCVSDHIEPVATLRRTVATWASEFPLSDWHRDMADNLLILLDPHISAEHFPSTEAAPKRDTSALPTWRNPSPMTFVPSGDPFLRVLQRPPPAALSLTEPTCITLRHAKGLCVWAEDACRVLAECVVAAGSHYVELQCPDLWRALPHALAWCNALGFECSASGLRSPAM